VDGITYIYYLHKGDNVPFYVGKSNNPLKQRLSKHKRIFGENIQTEILEEVLILEWKFWEKYWISQFKQWGFTLSNKNDGGGGINGFELEGKKHSFLTKEKMRNSKLGKPSNRKGKPCSEAHKKKLSESMKSKHSSPLKGITYHTKQFKDKIGLVHRGKTITEEHKLIISQTQKGKSLSESHKRSISEGSKNKKGTKYVKNEKY
jgi:hypothetical protein